MRGCCCPPAAVLLLLRAAGTSRRRVVSVARSRRALGSRRRKMCEGTEGHRSAVVASVLRPLAFFFCVFCAFSFFLLAHRRNRCRGRRHSIGLPCYCALAVSPCSWGSLRAADALPKSVVGRRAARDIFFWGRRRRGPSRRRTFRGQVGRLFPAGRPSPVAAVLRDSPRELLGRRHGG